MPTQPSDPPSTPSSVPWPTIILVQPREEGNIGSVARAMANLGWDRLRLVEPAPILGGVAKGFGVGGWHILERVERFATFEEAVAPFARLVGTTSARHRGARALEVGDVRGLATVLEADPPGTPTALVFGPEATGLSRRQLDRCDPWVTIPCAPEHPTLNLAQAVLLVAWEVGRAGRPLLGKGEAPSDGLRAAAGEVEALFSQADGVLDGLGYDQVVLRRRILEDLRRLAVRAGLTGREARLVRRLLSRVSGRLEIAVDPTDGGTGTTESR